MFIYCALIILKCLQSRGLLVQKEKCKFHRESIEFLGFVNRRGFIQMDPKKVESVASWLIPTRLKHLQAFLGFANFYQQFIKDYSQQALGRTKFLKKDRIFQWNDKAQASFEAFKKAFTHEKILQHFKQGVRAILETDASNEAIEGCLLQTDNA